MQLIRFIRDRFGVGILLSMSLFGIVLAHTLADRRMTGAVARVPSSGAGQPQPFLFLLDARLLERDEPLVRRGAVRVLPGVPQAPVRDVDERIGNRERDAL